MSSQPCVFHPGGGPLTPASEIFCARCGVLNSTTRARCRECGVSLTGAPEPPPSPPPPRPSVPAPPPVPAGHLLPDETACPYCRLIVSADQELCEGCGGRLREPEPAPPPPVLVGPVRICPRCRRKNSADAGFCWDCGAALVRESVGCPPAPPVIDPVVAGLGCPACGTTMEAGEAGLAMNYGRLTTWFAGSSWLELFFRRAGEQRKEWVMRPDTPSLAARCTRCGGIWLAPRTAPPDGPVP